MSVAVLLGSAALIGIFAVARSEAIGGSQAGDGVFDAAVLHRGFVAADGRLQGEEWIDRRSGATRKIMYHGEKRHGYVTLQNGSKIFNFDARQSGSVFLYEVIDPADPWLAETSSLLRPARALDRGKARVVAEGHLGGRQTVTVRMDPARSSVDADPRSLVGDAETLVVLDRETRLPLRYMTRVGTQSTSADVKYDTVDPDTLPASFFSFDRKWTSRVRRLRQHELAQLPFPVYTLGQTYKGLLFGSTIYSEERPKPGARIEIKPELFFGYVQGDFYSDDEIGFTEQAAETEDGRARLSAFRGQGAAHSVVIAGRARTVYLLDQDRQPVYFAVVVESTLIKGRAKLKFAEVLSMLADLKRVG